MRANGKVTTGGAISFAVTRAPRRRTTAWAWRLKNFFAQRWRELPTEAYLLLCKLASKVIPGANVPAHGRLYLTLTTADGEQVNLGCAGCHLITTAGKTYLAGCFPGTNEPENLKYHGFGTGTTSPSTSDTTLQTELTTQYASDNTRPTGTQSSSTNTYTTVGTLAPDASAAVTEWGLFHQASNAGGTLFDRQTFSAVNLASGDSLAATYVLTIS